MIRIRGRRQGEASQSKRANVEPCDAVSMQREPAASVAMVFSHDSLNSFQLVSVRSWYAAPQDSRGRGSVRPFTLKNAADRTTKHYSDRL
jgi:hypothetical protein